MSHKSPKRSGRDDKYRKDDRSVLPRSRTVQERLERKREWLIQQELEREHERLKRKKILEYEMKRKEELKASQGRSSHRSRSKSRSRSLESRPRRTSASSTMSCVMSEKLESMGEKTPLFKGPQGTKISAMELKKIKVDIYRNIPGRPVPGELQRDIIKPEDVVVKRRDGEGEKPIFEREEIQKATSTCEEVEERRTVVVVKPEASVSRSQPSTRRSRSLSSSRYHNVSPHRSSLRHSRYDEIKHSGDKTTSHSRYKDNSDRERSSERSTERRKKYGEKDAKNYTLPGSSRIRDYQSHSREARRSRSIDRERRDRDSHRRSRSERSHYEYREKSRNRSQERRIRDRSRDRDVEPHYIRQIPVPIYYGPRPIMVGPMVPFRGQIPFPRNRAPPMGPARVFPQRFMPPETVYRLGPPPNPRFGPMY